MVQPNQKYAKHFKEDSFWSLVHRIASPAMKPLISKALLLWYVWKSSNTPLWAKAAVMAALGYLIFTFDVVPDFLPVVGWTDDLAAIGSTIATVAAFITQDIQSQANQKTEELLGS